MLAALFAAAVLWILVYEIAVGVRYKKNDPTEGASRWALVRAQFADRDFSTFGWKTVLLGPRHFWTAGGISANSRRSDRSRRRRSGRRRRDRRRPVHRVQGEWASQAQRRRTIRDGNGRRAAAAYGQARNHPRVRSTACWFATPIQRISSSSARPAPVREPGSSSRTVTITTGHSFFGTSSGRISTSSRAICAPRA